MSKTMLIVAVVVLIIAAVVGYMMFGSGGLNLPSASGTTQTAAPATSGESAAQSEIDDAGASAASTEAEASVSDVAGEIGSVDSLEIPDV